MIQGTEKREHKTAKGFGGDLVFQKH